MNSEDRPILVCSALMLTACAGEPAIAAGRAAVAPVTFASLQPYVGEVCEIQHLGSGPLPMASHKDEIVIDGGQWFVHHQYTTRYGFGLHDGGSRPITIGSDGWFHFTSDSGSRQAFRPDGPVHLIYSIANVGKGLIPGGLVDDS